MKLMAILTTGLLAASTAGFAQTGQTTAAHMENLELTQECGRQAAGHCCQRTVRGGEGTGIGTLRTDFG